MKQEQVIELAKQAGFPFNKYGLLQGDEDGEIDADDMFELFASLVEQATLERAAGACDEFAGSQIDAEKQSGDFYCNLRASGAHACSMRIRNLAKDAQ